MLQGRKKCVTVFEILVPVFFALLLLMIRALSSSEWINNDTTYPSFSLATGGIPRGKTQLLYTPSNSYTDALMTTVQADTNATNCKSFKFCVLTDAMG